MLSTTFVPAKDGFQFSNNDVKWELHPGGPNGSFLCGGMIYTTLDHWYASMAMPTDPTPPPVRSPLNDYIFWRQASAHVYTVPRMTGGTILPFTTHWFVDSVASEFDRIRAGIAANKPVPVFLVEDKTFAGHHVLAIGCQSSPSLGNPIVQIYDPNRPGIVSEIHVDYSDRHFYNRAPGAAGGMYLKGFFEDRNYKAKRPPAFAPLTPPTPPSPGPTPPGPLPPGPIPPGPTPPGPLPPFPVPPGPLPPPGPVSRSYVVARGDSLSAIAKRMYGDANKWQVIYNANRATIGPNPNLILPGQNLTIPSA